MRAELFLDAGAELAESPVWDDRTNELVWVDILRGEVHRTSEDGSRDTVIDMGEHVGAVVLTEDGGMVAATKSGFRLVDADADHPLLAAVPDAAADIRMNDGKCDPAGRFVAGTMAYDESPGAGSLYSFDGHNVKRLVSDVTVSNGLAWSADGKTMYYVDTPTGRVDAFDYDVATGDVRNRREEVRIRDLPGKPDGISTDANGGLWVALWDGGAVVRYLNGTATHRIALPVPLVTSCAIGGGPQTALYVTTAKGGPLRREAGGHIFQAEVDVASTPVHRFRSVAFRGRPACRQA